MIKEGKIAGRAILLAGKPGTGKTAIAQVSDAAAANGSYTGRATTRLGVLTRTFGLFTYSRQPSLH
jgi:RuvB-like protein 2